jgi:hypothetical protein
MQVDIVPRSVVDATLADIRELMAAATAGTAVKDAAGGPLPRAVFAAPFISTEAEVPSPYPSCPADSTIQFASQWEVDTKLRAGMRLGRQRSPLPALDSEEGDTHSYTLSPHLSLCLHTHVHRHTAQARARARERQQGREGQSASNLFSPVRRYWGHRASPRVSYILQSLITYIWACCLEYKWAPIMGSGSARQKMSVNVLSDVPGQVDFAMRGMPCCDEYLHLSVAGGGILAYIDETLGHCGNNDRLSLVYGT